MPYTRSLVILVFSLCLSRAVAQHVINDGGLRLSLSAQKKINEKLTISGKVLSRQIDNFALFNRIYFRLGVAYELHKNLETELRLYYMYGRKGYKEFNSSFRYSLALIYKAKLSERFSFSNRLTYQITTNNLTNSDLVEDKTGGVVRNRATLKFKHTRRGEAYIKEELLWQVTGKQERYFGRNRVYLGYGYKLSQSWDLDAYFILERGFNEANGPQERNFFYGLNLGYNF